MTCKPPANTEAPWGSFDVPMTNTSTYSAAFSLSHTPAPAKLIKPKSSQFELGVPFQGRSTAQDAFQGINGGPRQSCKPKNVFASVPWQQPLTTTSSAAFVSFGAAKREPIRPTNNRGVEKGTKFDTRSTMQDAYAAHLTHRPSKPFIPKEAERFHERFDHTSTSRAAYVAHLVQPYVPAKKPKGSMDYGTE